MFKDFAARTHETAVYPEAGTGAPLALAYAALGLAGETGEVSAAWHTGTMRPADTGRMLSELGDCAWYLARLYLEAGLEVPKTLTPPDETIRVTALVRTLTSLSAEVAERAKKCVRGDDDAVLRLEKALDVYGKCWADLVAGGLAAEISDVLAGNAEKLAARKERHSLRGDGEDR